MISKEIESRISEAPYGSTFVISDFLDISNYDTARKTMSRMDESGLIQKISRGIYYKPKFSKMLNEFTAPSIDLVAEAIARNYGWTITPSGETALNNLGLSTQVPGRYTFISSGPYRKYDIGNTRIEFSHRADKELNGMSEKTMLIIQAIKAIGPERINDYIPKFKTKLTADEKKTLLSEGQRTTAWIYSAIKVIAKGD